MNINATINMFNNTTNNNPVEPSERNLTLSGIQSLSILTVCLLLGIWIGVTFQSCSYTGSPALESKVRQWASDYPSDLRDRWAWCYLDSAANWTTDQKLREDVRVKSTQVLTDTERRILTPLDDKIKAEIPKQKTPLQETYQAVGNGLQTAEWKPPPEPPPAPPKPTPNRRRIFRRP